MKYYVYLVLIYALLGWFIEVTFVSIKFKRFINRGFMLGPVIPLYAFGGISLTLLLNDYVYNNIVLFIMSMIICGVIEYFTSYICEKIFNLRWWDYSSRRFHINGRLALTNLIYFGILGVILLNIINPQLKEIYNYINGPYLSLTILIASTIFLIDFIISFTLTYDVKLDIKKINLDSTEEVKALIKDKYLNSLFKRRIINAFPDFRKIKKW